MENIAVGAIAISVIASLASCIIAWNQLKESAIKWYHSMKWSIIFGSRRFYWLQDMLVRNHDNHFVDLIKALWIVLDNTNLANARRLDVLCNVIRCIRESNIFTLPFICLCAAPLSAFSSVSSWQVIHEMLLKCESHGVEPNELYFTTFQKVHDNLSQNMNDVQILKCGSHFLGYLLQHIDRNIFNLAAISFNVHLRKRIESAESDDSFDLQRCCVTIDSIWKHNSTNVSNEHTTVDANLVSYEQTNTVIIPPDSLKQYTE